MQLTSNFEVADYARNVQTGGYTTVTTATHSMAQQETTVKKGATLLKACGYLEQELPAEATLDSLTSASKATWNAQVFSKVTTTETNTTYLTQLYSSLYGTHLIPSNRTGENPLWQSEEPYYDDCKWNHSTLHWVSLTGNCQGLRCGIYSAAPHR